MDKISVIVPVYKVEPYLRKCIDSICNQTFLNLEIILVDDGSPDSCGDICEEYAKKDARVIVVHKENGGLSDARNAGSVHATGDYIIFIDSDDYIALDMFEYLYTNIKEAKAEVSTCQAFDVYEATTKAPNLKEEVIVCDAEAFYSYILRGTKIRGEIWNKLFKREVIQGIAFPKGKLYEDIFFTADFVRNIKVACVGTAPKYYYVHRNDSITGKPYRKELLDIIEGYEKTYQVIGASFPNLEEEAQCLRIWARFIVLDKILLKKNYKHIPECKDMVRFLRAHIKQIWRNQHFQTTRKIAVLILSISISLYRRIVRETVRRQEK
jgi:Glycosyltransferases involved in cell wall biogenesis